MGWDGVVWREVTQGDVRWVGEFTDSYLYPASSRSSSDEPGSAHEVAHDYRKLSTLGVHMQHLKFGFSAIDVVRISRRGLPSFLPLRLAET